MGSDTTTDCEQTAKIEAGLNGLWKIGQKMTRMASGFKLMQNMAEVGVATGDIEHQARKRRFEREIKK